MEAKASILFTHLRTSFLPSSFPLLSKLPYPYKHSSSSFHISNSTLQRPLEPHLKFPSKFSSFRPTFQLHFSTEGVAQVEQIPDKIEDKSQKKKLFVYNFPWSFTPNDLKNAFSLCGTVTECEVIRNKDGKYRGFAFITMASGEEAQAVVDQFNSKELGGRIIKVEFAKRLKKPQPQSSKELPVNETRHKLYVSNLQWKARSSHLRDFFSADSNPVSARVVFESPNGRSAGYGFVSFSTREEAEAACSALNGKELLGRPVTLKFSERPSEGEAAKGDKEEEEKENQEDSVGPVSEGEISEAEHKS